MSDSGPENDGVWNRLLFDCAVCLRRIRDYPNRNGRDRHLKPLCRMCEQSWNERVGKLHAGAFMDRRKAMQINALAEALHTEACAKQWGAKYGRA